MLQNILSAQEIEHFLYVEDLEPIVYIGFTLALISLSYGLYRYYKRWTHGGQKIEIDNFGARLSSALKYGLLQIKVLEHPFAGIMHTLLYVGMAGMFINTFLRMIDDHRIFGLHPLVGNVYLWYKLGANIAGVMATLGAILALYRRITKGTRDLPDKWSDNVLLLGFIYVMVSGFVLTSISTMAYRTEWIGPFDPVGTAMIPLFRSMSPAAVTSLYRITWVSHLILVMLSIAILPFSKLSHILVGAFANTFMARPEKPALPTAYPNLMDLIEDENFTLGTQTAEHTNWKQRMDYDSCVNCARCHNVCPANLSGKKLSPMEIVQAMKTLTNGGDWDSSIWPESITPEEVWSCVTCGACVEECPLLIDQAESIMEMRRGLYFEEEHVEREVVLISSNIMNNGNPYGFGSPEKEGWLMELAENGLAELAEPDQEYDYLYWIGCVVAFDPNLRGSSESMLRLLKKAGKRVGIMAEEMCCGDPSRRIGDELMFSEMVNMNKEILEGYKYGKLITSCPHCFNSLKKEYSQYGCELDVGHHSEVLSDLVKNGTLKPEAPVDMKVTFHDSCYLGRWNNIYEEPRDVINAIPGSNLVEMPKNHAKSFCCGGGGSQLFYEIEEGERISAMRMDEAESVNPDAIVLACPYCNSMFRGESRETEILDLAELLEKSVK